jgi:hypothetical protein
MSEETQDSDESPHCHPKIPVGRMKLYPRGTTGRTRIGRGTQNTTTMADDDPDAHHTQRTPQCRTLASCLVDHVRTPSQLSSWEDNNTDRASGLTAPKAPLPHRLDTLHASTTTSGPLLSPQTQDLVATVQDDILAVLRATDATSTAVIDAAITAHTAELSRQTDTIVRQYKDIARLVKESCQLLQPPAITNAVTAAIRRVDIDNHHPCHHDTD